MPDAAAPVALARHADAHTAVRTLCRRLFEDPTRLTQTLTHQVTRPFNIAPHEHERTLQFDLILGCGGRAFAGGAWQRIKRVTALVSHPGQPHGYELVPGDQPSRVYHIKMKVEESDPRPPFPPLLTGLSRSQDLTAALQVVCRLHLVKQWQSPLMLARLAEALCLWPQAAPDRPEVDAGKVHAIAADPTHSDLAAAVDLIDKRVHDPPSMEEMAESVSYSPRHFARRFRALFGCTPHTYVTARRLDHARRLLLENRLLVHEVAEALGFSSVATFSRWFATHVGRPPTAFRNDPRVM